MNGRHLRRAVPALLTTVTVLVAGLFVTARHGSTGDGARTTAVPHPAGATCKEQPTREPCGQLVIDGRIRRYALLPAGRAATADTVLVDFGGPGRAALSGEIGLGRFKAAFAELGERYNLLVLEEPWVTQETDPGCAAALSGYYRAARSAPRDVRAAGEEMARRCGLAGGAPMWGFDARTFQQVVTGVTQSRGLRLRGFIGHSWGAIRLAHLRTTVVDWAVLVRPFPVGVGGPALIRERARLLAGDSAGVPWRPATTLPERSLPVTVFDEASAVVAAGDAEAGRTAGILKRDPGQVARLSDDLWKRYGVGSLSPANLAKFQEVCAATGPAPGGLSEIRTARDVLIAQHAPVRRDPPTEDDARPASVQRCARWCPLRTRSRLPV
ncbi:hypothetical protein AGRA3207_000990 [Actinomadura graeca]|uniref:Alpha/beta hydrolase n=1 Tax=Actinomadura graeca TaxID=2750812 RepID=A0ABX8QNE3_9ACTN|nr:hypothetical protein [Actinomadura graeca]QXJ20301.1 hypothetical protein AGRA3207_000990 [Actinomadura graeca]